MPTSLENNNYCYVFLDTNIIREYKTTNLNQDNDYTDFNTSNHYNYYASTEYLTTSPNCLDHNNLTNDFYYRNDFSHILVIFLILSIFIFYIPFRLFCRFYRKGR